MIELKKIEEAKDRLKNVVYKTPTNYAPYLSAICGANIYLKKENLQHTGSFKLRGAFNKIALLSDEERKRGIIASSAGNHAQGVAYSAKHFSIDATIVMPKHTPLLKVNGVIALGAEVILEGDNYDEAYAYATSYAQKNSLTFIHPYEDPDVIAGQGSIALEMIEDVGHFDTILTPIGGGGLISGIGAAFKQKSPNTKVIGVTAKGAPAMRESFLKKCPIDSKGVKTIADGIAVRDTSPSNLNRILKSVDDIIEVDDEEIAEAILFILEKQKLTTEGAGATGVAALLAKKVELKKEHNVGVILSGGNIDVTMLSVIIEKGLLKSHRKMRLQVTLIDRPGSLRILTDIFERLGANIVEIGYDRFSSSLKYGDANVTISLETKGENHQKEIAKALINEGFLFEQID